MVSQLNSWPVAGPVGQTGWVYCLTVLALICGAHPAWAGKYAYGENFVRVGHSWADAGLVRARSEGAAGSAAENDDDYLQQVALLEVQGGPYSDALAEPLASLGRIQRQQGDLDQATRLYRRALHIVRVNDGLYSERQIPILRELLDVYRISGDLPALDARYDYYFRLYGNGQAPYTEVRLRAMLAYLRWQREAVRLQIDGDESRRLLELYQLNDKLLAAVGADTTVALSWYRELVLSQLHNLYLLEDRFAPTVENSGITQPLPMVSNDWNQEDFNKRRLETIQRGALSRGTGLLQDLIARTAAEEGLDLARLHLELGDWYQWHGSEHRAGEQYQQVVHLLTENSQMKLLRQWLGEPVELPDNGAFWQPAIAEIPQHGVVVNVRYDVSARGRVSNMQASVSDPAAQHLASRLKRKLGQIRFRPRWDSGAAEAVAQIQRDYEFTEPQ